MASQEELKKRLKALMNRAENQVCSDCPERQPRWASLIVPPPGAPPGTQPIGAFCCLECSGSHRRLGVHISFVRSVNLDSWKEKEVLAMENGGNRKVNAIFEARLPSGFAKPQAGADGPTRERFIRDKYERRKFYDPSGFDFCAPEDDDPEDDVRSRFSSSHSARSSRSTPPIRPPSDAARQRVETRQARVVMERRGSDKAKVPKAPRSAPASFDLLDLSAPPITTPAPETNFLQPTAPATLAPTIESAQAPLHRNSYAADLLAPVQPTQSNTSSINNSGPVQNSHDHILSLFNAPPSQPAVLGVIPVTGGDFNPLMLNPNMIMQQQQPAMMNMMVQPRSNMMNMMQQQQLQQQRMLHQRTGQEQPPQQQQAASTMTGFGANVMVQPKSSQETMQQSFHQSFHQSFIYTNDGYDNGYNNSNNSNNMGYGGNQLQNHMNLMAQQQQFQQQQQQQQQQQSYPGMMMSSSMHGGMGGGGMSGSGMSGSGMSGGASLGGMMPVSSAATHDEGFPSVPMGGNVMASSGPLVSGMHRPMGQSPPPPSELPPKPPRKEDPFAQFGMNVFRS